MRLLILGGGVTGLAAANRALEIAEQSATPVEVLVLEGGPRPGGLIATDRRDGLVIEAGPDSMITDKPWGLALARRLGLEEELIQTRERFRRSFVVRKGSLHPVPEGFQLLAPARFGPLISSPIFSPAGKLRMALDLVLPRRRDPGDESLGAFVTRRLGREALERIAQPMIAGIYGGDPFRLSMAATMPRFRDMEAEHGSVIRAMRARARAAEAAKGVSGARYGLFVSFRFGMQTLIDALAERIGAERIRTGCRAVALERVGERWRCTLDSGEKEDADRVVAALPAPAAASLLAPLDSEAASLLREIPYASCAVMTLGFRREQVRHPLDGFGFVAPSAEGLSMLGCTFSSVKWEHRAPDGIVLIRPFIGEGPLLDAPDEELVRVAAGELAGLLGIEGQPLFRTIARLRRAMPQYPVGHLDRIARLETLESGWRTLALAGNAYRGVGIPDSIHSGESAAERLLLPPAA